MIALLLASAMASDPATASPAPAPSPAPASAPSPVPAVAQPAPPALASPPPMSGIVGCPAAVAASAFAGELEPAERAYGEATDAAITEFRQRIATLRAELPCLGEELPASTIARVHRVFGLSAWLDRAAPGTLPARVYFAAARHLEPDYVFPTWLVGPEDPEAHEYAGVLVDVTPARAEPERTGLAVRVDGDASGLRHPDWPALLQWTNAGSNTIRCSEYLPPGESSRCAAALGAPITAIQKRRTRGVLGIAGGVVALGGGAALELWTQSRRADLGLETDCSDVRAGKHDGAPDCSYSEGHLSELDAVSSTDSAVAVGLMAIGGVGIVYGGITFFVDAGAGPPVFGATLGF